MSTQTLKESARTKLLASEHPFKDLSDNRGRAFPLLHLIHFICVTYTAMRPALLLIF